MAQEAQESPQLPPLDLNFPDAPEGEFGRTERYAIKKWKPRHSQVVFLHVAGYSNKSIAAQTDFNPEHVSYLLNDPRAQKAIREIEERMFKNFDQRTRRKMQALGDMAIDNIAQTVMADLSDVSVGSKAKKHQDDVSFELLDRIGYGRKQASRPGDDQGTQLPEQVGERLAEAIEKSEVAEQADEIEMVETEDGEWKARKNGGGEDSD